MLLYFIFSFLKREDFIVFCDVSQGDATYIRIESTDMLIDAGPSRKVLECLGKNMPFWDKKIEIAILSHPQKDHYGGFLYIFPRYKVENFLMPSIEGKAFSFKKLEELLEKEKTNLFFPTAGNIITIKNTTLTFFWPTKEFISNVYNANLNNYSLVFKLKTKNLSVLFTGDIGKNTLDNLSVWAQKNSPLVFKTDILKIPHHGSKNSLSPQFIKLANPKIALISSGKNNSYDHPHTQTINLLKTLNIKIWRTDKLGSLKVKLRQ